MSEITGTFQCHFRPLYVVEAMVRKDMNSLLYFDTSQLAIFCHFGFYIALYTGFFVTRLGPSDDPLRAFDYKLFLWVALPFWGRKLDLP